MKLVGIGFMFLAFICFEGDALKDMYALVLDDESYGDIQSICTNSPVNFTQDRNDLNIATSSYFIRAPPNIVTPRDYATAFQLYNYLLQFNNYTAIVAPYNNFLPPIAAALNMLYYVYDYNLDQTLSKLLEQVNEIGYQVQNSLLTPNVRLAHSYYNLIQIADELISNSMNDPILKEYSASRMVYILCDTAADAELFVSITNERFLQPIIIALDQFIGEGILDQCFGDFPCGNTALTCAQVCQLYNLAYAIQEGINNGIVATIFVIMGRESQISTFPMFADYGRQLGLFSSNLVWIFAELWLPASAMVQLIGSASPIYVISIPSLNSDILRKYVCADFVVQMMTTKINGDKLPCAISQESPSPVCTDISYYGIFYSGYMPSDLTFPVRRLSFSSKPLFLQLFVENTTNLSYSFATQPSVAYVIENLPTENDNQMNSNSKNGSKSLGNVVNWLPNANSNCSQTDLKSTQVPLVGAELLKATSLTGQSIYALGTLYEPLLMRMPDYDELKQNLIQENLYSSGYYSSSVILYPTSLGCIDYIENNNYNWCFFNASSYGIQPDLTYAQAYSNATNLAAGGSIVNCPINLLLPHVGNLDLYTGFAADLLGYLEENLSFSVEIVETTENILQIAKLMDNDRRYAISAVLLTVNDIGSQYVDFLSPSTTSGINLIMSNRTYDPTWQILFPFGGFVWILIILSIIVTTCTFMIIDRLSKNETKYYTIDTMFAYTYASFTQGAVDVTPKRLSARLLSMFMWFVVMLLLSSYTSAMSVVLLTPPTVGCVNELFDLLDCNVMFNAAPNSVAELMLNFPEYANLSANRKFRGQFSDIMQYFNTNNNVSDFHHFAHIGDMAFNKYYYAKYCTYLNISVIGQPAFTQFRSFVTPKGTAYRKSLNAALLNSATSGARYNISKEWFPDPPDDCTFQTTAKSLSFTDMAGLFWILLIGSVLAVACVLLEVLKQRCTLKALRRKSPQLQFGQVYEASVVSARLDGVEVDIKAQPESFFVSYENLNLGTLQLKFPHELGIREGTTLYLKYFGIEKKTKLPRFVLVKMESNVNQSILVT